MINKWIGEMTVATMRNMAAELLETYQGKLDAAFMKSEDGKLKISLTFDVSMSQSTQNAVDVDATIAFTAEKIKDKIEKSGISELQIDLMFPGKENAA